jgi:hypothetical protein
MYKIVEYKPLFPSKHSELVKQEMREMKWIAGFLIILRSYRLSF